ncbi:biotin carboxylase [Saccharopolyspora spinosa]|uniref:Biotin carboxylase n=3 Tax=Saccharopolyspora spinosa TaxID=60894 RepID=A0A2N3Y066_SACSN|nr:biotin carboxylase [Saccharopolyspora spinosa]
MQMSTRLAVVYDRGAVSPAEISSGLRGLGEVVFLCPETDHNRDLLPLLREMGQVIRLSSDRGEAVRQVAGASPDAILTFSERALPITSALGTGLGLPVNSEESVRRLTDKFLQRSALRDAGVDSVECAAVSSVDEWWRLPAGLVFPVVVKPSRGAGSRNVHVVADERAGEELVARLLAPVRTGGAGETRLVVEELLTGRDCAPFGDYVSVESLVCDGVVSHIAITGKLPLSRPFREVGQFWPSTLSERDGEPVLRLAAAAVRALGMRTGLVHTEVKLCAEGPRVIEVNGRLGGWINDLSTRAAGLNLVELAGRVALGERARVDPVAPDRVYFKCNNLPPLRPCRFEGVDGVDQVRRIPGLTGYRPLVRPGAVLDGSAVDTYELDVITGDAADHRDMLGIIDAVSESLTFVCTIDGRQARFRGPELAAL